MRLLGDLVGTSCQATPYPAGFTEIQTWVLLLQPCQLLLLMQQPILLQFTSVQSLSCVRLFATPWIAACQASLSITNSQSLLKVMPIESVMPSSHLIFCRPLLLLLPVSPSIRVFSNELTLVAKVLEFQLQHQFFQWTPRTDLLYDGLVGCTLHIS